MIPDLGSRYRVIRPLGYGATADVFLVEDRQRNGTQLALKLLRDPAHLPRLQTEFGLLSSLAHPNLARILDLELGRPGPHVTHEYVQGSDIASWARGRALQQVLPTLAGALRALHFLHLHGWVHGDVRPANVLITPGGKATVLDLGMAVRTGQPTGGTTGFVAPELLSGGEASAVTDVYSAAALLLTLLTDSELEPDGAAAVAEQLEFYMRLLDHAGEVGLRFGKTRLWLELLEPAARPPLEGVLDLLAQRHTRTQLETVEAGERRQRELESGVRRG